MPLHLLARALLVLGCSASLLACHRKRHARNAAGPGASAVVRVDEVVKWDTQLTEDLPGLVRAFVERAQLYGCAIHKNDPNAAAATCDGVRIAMAKSDLMVSVGCRGVTLEQCRALFRRVVETETPAGAVPVPNAPSEPPPPKPPTTDAPPPGGGTSI